MLIECDSWTIPAHPNCRCYMNTLPTHELSTVTPVLNQKEDKTMAKTKTTHPGIRVGAPPPPASGSGEGFGYLSLKDGDQFRITLLAGIDEMISVQQYAMWNYKPAPIWASIGPDDPGEELGLNSKYRAIAPVKVTVDGEDQIKLWSFGIQIHRELEGLAQEYETLEGLILRIGRTGTGLTTRYSVIPTGKFENISSIDVPSIEEIVETLGPDSREGIIQLIEQRASMPYSTILGKLSAENESGDDFEADEL